MLNKANSAAANLLDQSVTEINTALANARERLKGVSAQGGQPAVTTQHILDEADPITLASLEARPFPFTLVDLEFCFCTFGFLFSALHFQHEYRE
jgi:hypothetical protein